MPLLMQEWEQPTLLGSLALGAALNFGFVHH